MPRTDPKTKKTSRSSGSQTSPSDDAAAAAATTKPKTRPTAKKTAKQKPGSKASAPVKKAARPTPATRGKTGSSIKAPSAAREPELGQIDTSFFIIGVGASAGGLDAIRAFISQIPADCPYSFIFIQHISPDYKSMMGDPAAPETALRIEEVKDNMPIEPGHIYVIPPKSNVIIQGTHPVLSRNDIKALVQEQNSGKEKRGDNFLRFALLDQPPRPSLNLPIDLFFHSLAEAVGNRAIGVILSGTGSDGSRGLRTIKDTDGFVMVQDPQTAAFDGMPRAAIGTDLVDLIIPPDEMAKELYRYIELRQSGAIELERLFENADDLYHTIIGTVSDTAHIDFTKYKRPTLQRRIARRMALKQCATLTDYLGLIQKDPNEIRILYREFLVGVTHFFRDMPAWELIRTQVLPELFETEETGGQDRPLDLSEAAQTIPSTEPIKVWSIGCSTGEEAYTIAILMEDFRQKAGISRDFRVFATDVNERSIEQAKEGVFAESAIDDIPTEFANRYFSYKSGGLSVSDTIRKKVIFSEHNVIESPPYIHTDLIICRNILIYMTPALQSQLIATFSYSLKPGRFLFLGASESVERGYSRFEAYDKRWRVFRNIARAQARDVRNNDATPYFSPIFASSTFGQARHDRPSQETLNADLLDVILPELDACAVLVNDRWEVIETHGQYKKYLSLPADQFSAKIIDLVPERLSSTISIAIRQATIGESTDHQPIRLMLGNVPSWVSISCKKFTRSSGQTAFLLMIREVTDPNLPELPPARTTPVSTDDLDREHYIIELESELAKTRETLEATIEDLGSSNEELQSSNEELMSANEELQSTGEEMQSVNEELHTINAEHAEKISELEAAYADIDNLLKSTNLAIVFLDQDLRIRRFSDAIKVHFNLDERDIGRPISHFSSSLALEDNRRIFADVELTLSTGDSKSYEVLSLDGSWYLASVQPFQNMAGDPSGAVLSFVDITKVKTLQEELETHRDVLEAVLEGQMAGYWDWDIPGDKEYMSPQLKAMFGYDDHEVPNTPQAWRNMIHPDDLPGVLKCFDEHVASRGDVPYDNEVRCRHKDGSTIWVWCRGKVIEWDTDGNPIRMVGGHIDITALKTTEEQVLARAEEIRRFAYVSAHDLREPMQTIENYISLLQSSLKDTLDDQQIHLMEFVTSASKRMKAQIAGVVEYAKLQEGTYQTDALDMNALVATCLDDLEDSISSTSAKIETKTLPKAHASGALITRVIQNLLSNAMKFQKPGAKPAIEISGRKGQKGFNTYRITDNGIGIAKKYREKVFDLFSRLNAQSDYEGVGMGLALCKQIINEHGGKMWIEDGMDGGISVVFTLRNVGSR